MKKYCLACSYYKMRFAVGDGIYCSYKLNPYTKQPQIGQLSMAELNEKGECPHYKSVSSKAKRK